jgi:hypothetical protein
LPVLGYVDFIADFPYRTPFNDGVSRELRPADTPLNSPIL